MRWEDEDRALRGDRQHRMQTSDLAGLGSLAAAVQASGRLEQDRVVQGEEQDHENSQEQTQDS